MKSKTARLIAAVVFLLIAGVTAMAQQNTGIILGVVKDSSSAVVPGASITIVNEETSLTRTVTSGENGAYRAPALPVGRYTLRVELPGFRSQTQRGLILEVAQELVVNPTLEVGALPQEEIVVSGEAPLVNTTSSALGSVVNEQSMSDLPLNGRNYVDLTMLQPGISQQTLATTGGGATALGSPSGGAASMRTMAWKWIAPRRWYSPTFTIRSLTRRPSSTWLIPITAASSRGK